MKRRTNNREFLWMVLLCALAVSLVTHIRAIFAAEVPQPVTVQANELVRAGRIDEAVNLLETSLAAHPKDLNTRLALGELYGQTGMRDKAEQELREALRLYPESLSAASALGSFYVRAGSWQPAEKVFDEALLRHPKEAQILGQLALVLAAQHKYKEAQADLHVVPLPADPAARVRYLRLSASIYSGLGETRAAAKSMERALQIVPANQELQLLAAVAEAEAGEWQACIFHVGPLFSKHPTASSGLLLLRAQLAGRGDFMPVLQKLDSLSLPVNAELELRTHSAAMLSSAEKHVEAAEELRQAIKIAGAQDETLLYDLAVEQYALGQFDDASATLGPLQAQHDSAEIEDLLGDIEEQKSNSSAAILDHRKAVDLAPEEERYRLSLGGELLKYRAYDAAVSVFRQDTHLFPNSARAFVGLGMAYYSMEKYEESMSAFLMADKLDGGSARAVGYLGSTQMDIPTGPLPAAVAAICDRAARQPTEAVPVTWCGALLFRKAYLTDDKSAAPDVIRHLRLANRLAPNDALTNCSLGRALAWEGQLALARQSLEICVRLRPDSAEDHYRLGHIYQALGLRQAAADQADLTAKANAKQEQRESMTDQFAQEMVGQSQSIAAPK